MTDPVPSTRPGSVDRGRVRVKALAVILDEQRTRHAVFRLRNQAGEEFSRPLGGSVEFGESTEAAAVREIREELGATFIPDALLGVVENIFELDGESGHEIDFLYVGRMADPNSVPLDGRDFLDGDQPGWAEWRSIEHPPADVALYPVELQGMLEEWLTRR